MLAIGLVGALLAAGCGDDGDGDGDAAGTTSTAAGNGNGAAEETGTVKIAVLSSESGEFSGTELPVNHGIRMALDEINAEGFEVDGTTYTFDVEYTDVQSDPAVATQAAQQAIQGFGAKFILGPTVSPLAEPVFATALRTADTPLVFAAATIGDQFAGKGDPIFRTLPPDQIAANQYIPVLAEEFPEVEQIAALMINDTVGQSILDLYPPIFEENGVEVLSEDGFPLTETNFAPLIQRPPADIDGWFIGHNDPVAQAIAEAAIEADRPTIFFHRGSSCAAGEALADRIEAFTCQVFTDDPFNPSTPEGEEFFAKYEEEHGEMTSSASLALFMYDYVFMLVQAMQEAGSVDDVEAIADAIRGSSYDGVLDISYDEDGINQSSIKVGIVRDGELTIIPGASG